MVYWGLRGNTILVYVVAMSYQTALTAYLETSGKTQAQFAAETGIGQGSISRYVKGRLPDREQAETIDRITNGGVPLALWQSEWAKRLGLTPPADQRAAA
ncbi:MAG: helix-turn-helix transcriptional regulator [Pseudomonadota bacterium]